jgi:hypothetical protein
MAYRAFTLDSLSEKFGLEISNGEIALEIKHFEPSSRVLDDISEGKSIPYITEKARSELFIIPIFRELHRKNKTKFNFYSGYTLDADKKLGLNGECDFLFSKTTNRLDLQPPIFSLMEAKQDKIEASTAQCAAQMYGAYIYNQKKGKDTPVIYGATTNAFEWLFLKLEDGKKITIDVNRYTLNDLTQLLGIFQGIVDTYE